MADDISDLNIITSHPSYARAISLEIGKNNEDSQTKPKRRRRPSKKSRQEAAYFEELDILIGSDLSDLSDLSEYYSAEEDLRDLKIDSGTDETVNDSATFTDDESMEQATNLKIGRSRAPSKKQKRRRRELKNKILGDFNVPFQEVENLDFELEEMMEDIRSCDAVVQKDLPSLFELCLSQVKSSTNSMMKYDLLPNRIKTIINKWKQKRLFLQIQYTWLQRILAAHEEKDILQTYSTIKDNNDFDTEEGKWVFAYKVRNVWTLQQDSLTEDEKESSYLNHTINKVSLKPPDFEEKWNNSTVLMLNLLAVLCNMIELLLQQLDDRKIRETDSNEILERKLKIVRYILAKKYPNIVDSLYDDAVPYIYWAHGNNQAGAHFLQLASKAVEKDDRRIILLAEAARFYTHINDINLASKLHRQAADILLSKSAAKQDLQSDVKGQMLILLANLYDTGPMVPAKSRQSLESWKHVYQSLAGKIPSTTWVEAATSCLCYHCGVWQEGDTSQIETCLKFLNAQGRHCPLLHKSFIEALLGLQIPSRDSYRHYCGTLQLSSPVSRVKYPWKPIVDSHQNIKLLPVMWRTQMQFVHIRGDKDVVNEFDVQASDLNFCISSRGHLTGDFQMLLPPLKTVELDLYTGQQVFYSNSKVTNTWHFDDFDPVRCNNYYYNPTLTEIYNYQGNTVHVLMVSTLPGSDVVYHQDGLNNLYWTGSEGDTVRLNLFRFIKNQWREVILRDIEAEQSNYPKASKSNRGSTIWVEEMKESLDNLYKNEAEFDLTTVDQNRKNLKKAKKEKEKNKPKEKNSGKPLNKMKKFPNKIVKYFRYGSTLFLLVQTTNLTTMAVFIDCSSKDKFLNPVMNTEYQGYFIDKIDDCLPTIVKQVVPRTETIWWFCKNPITSKNALVTFKQGGEFVHADEKDYNFHRFRQPLILNNIFYTILTEVIETNYFQDEEMVSQKQPFEGLVNAYLVGSLLLVRLKDKLIFLHPVTLERQTIQVSALNCSLPVKDGDNEISNDHDNDYVDINVIDDNDDNGIIEVVVAIDFHLMILHIDESRNSNINVVLCIETPGHAKEFKHISKKVSFLVCLTMSDEINELSQVQTDHVIQYKYNGEIVGVLPFLGSGPRDMFTVFLHGDDNVNKKYEGRLGQKGCYVYLRDGHGAIMSLYLGPS